MPDAFSQDKRSEIMKKVKAKDTRLEKSVRSALWRLGYRFRKHDPNLPGKPDMVFAGAKTVVFIDSCFWHGCPKHLRMPKSNRDYWRHKIEGNRTRDEDINRQYRDLDWQAIRIWEHTIRESFEETICKLAEILEARYARGSLPPKEQAAVNIQDWLQADASKPAAPG